MFTLQLAAHIREQILRSHRLHHVRSLINLSDLSSDESSRAGGTWDKEGCS
jgi:E3 ubiquitin-protein ligase ATL6/9/15/31/42/55